MLLAKVGRHRLLLLSRLPTTPAAFSTDAVRAVPQLPPRPVIKEEDIEEAFLKGSGPGGQKINKTSSAVQLKHLPTGLVVKSQATRSRSQNRKISRRILAEKLEQTEKGPESRIGVKAEIKRKKKASKTKKARRKYRDADDEAKNVIKHDGQESRQGTVDKADRSNTYGKQHV